MPVLNYGYVPTEEALGFPLSEFSLSIYDIVQDAVVVDIAKFDKPAGVFMGMNWYKDTTVSGGTLSQNLYTGQALTADKIYQSTLDAYAGNWKDRMEQYLVQQGQ